tara:strand:+ start:160 stop:723 length:564 start_codon:yes stop_codon:yes gene_type:complete
VINERAKAILEFCFVKTELEQWFKKDDRFDKILENNFMKDYLKAINNEYNNWSNNPEECVALIMLLDQLSRNFFRNSTKAYDQDSKCISIVKNAINKKYLEKLSNDKIHFLLLPLLHSEDIIDHDFGHQFVDQYLNRHPEYNNIKKAWNDHTFAIRKFGRYPHRNNVLKRESSMEELDFLKQPNSSW